VKGLFDFCTLSNKSIYQYHYIDAFAFACAIKDISIATLAYNLIEDNKHLSDTKIPKYFITWFNKNK
jgi:hypothetical protein